MHFCQDEATGLLALLEFVPHFLRCAWWHVRGWVE